MDGYDAGTASSGVSWRWLLTWLDKDKVVDVDATEAIGSSADEDTGVTWFNVAHVQGVLT